MSPEVLRQLLTAEPFVPLSISMTDHSAYFIESANEAKLSEDGSALLVTQRGEWVFASLAQIVSISVIPSSRKFLGFSQRGEERR